jgi:hypothetical protein
MLVANAKIVLGSNRPKLKSTFSLAIRHQHPIERARLLEDPEKRTKLTGSADQTSEIGHSFRDT